MNHSRHSDSEQKADQHQQKATQNAQRATPPALNKRQSIQREQRGKDNQKSPAGDQPRAAVQSGKTQPAPPFPAQQLDKPTRLYTSLT